LTAAFCGLRWGELAGLRRRRVDLLHKKIVVAEQLSEVNGALSFGPPKTDAGRRTLTLPAFLADEFNAHLGKWSEPGPDGLVFPAPEGGPMRRSNFRRRVWVPTLDQLDLVGLRFHDLHHSAGTMTAIAGATTKELMARMGHQSPQAALSTNTRRRSATPLSRPL
jgi:integrase